MYALAPPRQPVRQAIDGLFNAAGGLPYHWSALRYRRALWTPYRQAVARVLADWAPPQPQLVIVGPSAGWNLPAKFLSQFQEVVAVEPDPLARWLLARRFPTVQWRWDTDDYFTPDADIPWQANLDRLFARYPSAAVLFSEFLGQLITLYPAAVADEQHGRVVDSVAFDAWKANLRRHLQARSFCTLHDRWAASEAPLGPPSAPVDIDGAVPPGIWPPDALVVDPLTAGLTPPGQQRLLLWQRLPDRWHAMAAVWSNL